MEEDTGEQQQPEEKDAAVGGAYGFPDSQKDPSAGGWYGCPSSEKDAPAGGVYTGNEDASEDGAYGCGREQSQGDDGGKAQMQVVHNDIDKEDACLASTASLIRAH